MEISLKTLQPYVFCSMCTVIIYTCQLWSLKAYDGWIPTRPSTFILNCIMLGIVIHNTSALLILSKTKLSYFSLSLYLEVFRYFFFLKTMIVVFYLRDKMTSQEVSLCMPCKLDCECCRAKRTGKCTGGEKWHSTSLVCTVHSF